MPVSSNRELIQSLKEVIQSSPEQIISFADYMAIALYEPDLGYYASSHRQLGPQGDFVTSSHLAKDYGELIGIQLFDCWQGLDCPSEFTVVEVGAGQGLVSADALSYLAHNETTQAFVNVLKWKIVETSPSLIKWQQHYLGKRLRDAGNHHISIEWTTLEALQSNPIVGCVFSNELVDALPFHLLQIQAGQFHEVGITLEMDTFVETTQRVLSSGLEDYLNDMELRAQDYPEGYRCEVNLNAKDWIESVAKTIEQGFVLTIDYGYHSSQLYSPARQGGTLQCYTQQKSHDDPLINVGNQDITSHVNFTALEMYGKAQGLDVLAFTQQGLFLMALGLGDRLVANNSNTDLTQINDILQRRETLHALINPMGLGGFKVLLQGKGLTTDQKTYPYLGFQSI